MLQQWLQNERVKTFKISLPSPVSPRACLYNTQHNDIQHNDYQHKGLTGDTQHERDSAWQPNDSVVMLGVAF
jgi:hypothetical protein